MYHKCIQAIFEGQLGILDSRQVCRYPYVLKLKRTNCDATMLPMPISAEQHLTGSNHAWWVKRGLMERKSCSLICSGFFDYPSLFLLRNWMASFLRIFFTRDFLCARVNAKFTYLAREHSPGSIKIRLNSIAVKDSSVPYATLICWQTHHPHNLASTTLQLQRISRFNHNHAITSTPSSSSPFHLAFVENSSLISSS